MTDEATALLDKADHALRAARLLLTANEIDSAVSRGYYAMFYIASSLLLRKGARFRKHSAVHAAFGEQLAKTGELDAKFHRWLLDAFDLRAIGDYGVGATLTAEDAQTVITHAEELLEHGRSRVNRSAP